MLNSIFNEFGHMDYYETNSCCLYKLSTIDKNNTVDELIMVPIYTSGNHTGNAIMRNPYFKN